MLNFNVQVEQHLARVAILTEILVQHPGPAAAQEAAWCDTDRVPCIPHPAASKKKAEMRIQRPHFGIVGTPAAASCPARCS